MASRKQRGELDGKIAGLYDLEQTIGKGHFAVVKLARHVFTGEKVAVKVIDKTKLDEVSKSHLFQEVRCMKLVQHPHVVRLYEVIDTATKLYLILELGDGGDMYDYIMTKYEKKGLDDVLARKYFKQIVEAIAYCHKLHVVHRDLKPENVVFFEKLGVVKLTDFGFSNMFNPGKKLETSCGSLAYSAPEILLGDSYDAPKVDIWSLGVILFMLVCGTPPFQEANDSETLTMIMDCKYHIPSHVNKHCRQLIMRMLIRDPAKRATLNEIMLNPWISGGSNSTSPPIQMPLISRELISMDVQNYVVEKMYEGNIASREEIMQSLDKDAYDHIAATYYLLAERKMKRQQQEMLQAAQRLQGRQSQTQQATGQNGKPHLEPLSLSPRVRSRVITDMTTPVGSTEEKYSCSQPKDTSKEKTHGLIQSLVSPISNHSQPSSVSDRPKSPENLALRKYSLIKEESFEDEMEDLSDRGKDIVATKSLDNLEDMSPKSPNKMLTPASSADNISGRRPLVSVASSPQLLNQISEENESEEEDYVPTKLPSRILGRNSVASPEMLRKFEQRKKRRGAGQRGTSCSSSDASDTDDTEGRSRKDKLKHRFIHRRDSSDHSSDTDGPNGHGGNLGGGHHFSSSGGGQGGGGGSGGKSQKKDKGDKGGGSGHKGGHSRHHGMRENHSHNTNSLTTGGSDFSMSPAVSSLSLGSTISKSSQKYILEEDEGEKENMKDSWTYNVNSSTSHRSDSEYSNEKSAFYIGKEDKMSVCSADCSLHHRKQKRSSSKVKTDINSNGLHPNLYKTPGVQHVQIETKCCSVV